MGAPQDWQLERYRPLLCLQARQLELSRPLRRRFDSSDLVQEALLRAQAGLGGFRGQSEAELVGWLQAILANVLTDAVRTNRARKRDVALERSLEAALGESSARLEAYLTAGGPSPAEQVERHEQLLRLAAALAELPDDQRDVIILHHLLDTPVAEAAEQLERTERAVAGLLFRARRRLRQMLDHEA
jgi:RNA polymerase sigma-70 factor (ECF subfamily)